MMMQISGPASNTYVNSRSFNGLATLFKGLYVYGGRGRKRTDADIFINYIFLRFFFAFFLLLAYIDLRGQLERDPESDRLGHPPTHHDLMKIY